MEKIYVISRYRAPTENGREFNRKVARHFCRQLVYEGKQPIAPHLYYPQFLNDDDPNERTIGTARGLEELAAADGYLLVIVDGIISAGMRDEIIQAVVSGKPGRVIQMTKAEALEALRADP